MVRPAVQLFIEACTDDGKSRFAPAQLNLNPETLDIDGKKTTPLIDIGHGNDNLHAGFPEQN